MPRPARLLSSAPPGEAGYGGFVYNLRSGQSVSRIAPGRDSGVAARARATRPSLLSFARQTFELRQPSPRRIGWFWRPVCWATGWLCGPEHARNGGLDFHERYDPWTRTRAALSPAPFNERVFAKRRTHQSSQPSLGSLWEGVENLQRQAPGCEFALWDFEGNFLFRKCAFRANDAGRRSLRTKEARASHSVKPPSRRR